MEGALLMFGSNHQSLRFPKTVSLLDKRQADRDRKREWREVQAAVKLRDKGLCRCCGKRGEDAHHLIYRSHSGASTLNNLVWLCRTCHSEIHAKLIRVEWGGTAGWRAKSSPAE